MSNRNKVFISNHREEIKANADHLARFNAIGLLLDVNPDDVNLKLTEDFYNRTGHIPTQSEDKKLNSWRSRIVCKNKHPYIDKLREMGLKTISEVQEENKQMVSDWLRVEKRFPRALISNLLNI